ncbi:MAG: RNA polymerase sigma factor [Ardenticatenaceae bacterium]
MALKGPSSTTKSPLRQFIKENEATLLRTLSFYVQYAKLAYGPAAQELAVELLSEVTIEALTHATRFDASRRVMPWLLGIASNLIKRKKDAYIKHAKREPFLEDLHSNTGQAWDDEALWDWVTSWRAEDPAQQWETEQQTTFMLSLVSQQDQHVLRLGVIQGLSGKALAQALDITPGAARVRLHRAKRRLGKAWAKAERAGENIKDE